MKKWGKKFSGLPGENFFRHPVRWNKTYFWQETALQKMSQNDHCLI